MIFVLVDWFGLMLFVCGFVVCDFVLLVVL